MTLRCKPLGSAGQPEQRSVGVQAPVPSREYIGPRARATQSPEFLKDGWLHRPKTVSTLCVTLAIVFVAAQLMSGQESSRRSRVTCGCVASTFVFLVFGSLQLPDGLLVRPSPLFWRFVKSCSILYLLGLTFILFQDLDDVRAGLHSLDPAMGVPLEERNYAEGCGSWSAVQDKLDVFVLAHFFGWMIKALVIREWRLLWALSILFELMEVTFRHVLPNFWECWWDHVVLDVLGCNLLGIWVGLKLCKHFQMKQYLWHRKYSWRLAQAGSVLASGSSSGGSRSSPEAVSPTCGTPPAEVAPVKSGTNATTFVKSWPIPPGKRPSEMQRKKTTIEPTGSARALRSALGQLVPYELTTYTWPSVLESAKSFTGIVFFCIVVTLVDLNVFFIKAELYIEAHHWIIISRLALISLTAASGTREFYSYLTDDYCRRMGLQCWLALAMVGTEALLAAKWYFFGGALQPHEACPTWIPVFWIGAVILIISMIFYLLVFPAADNRNVSAFAAENIAAVDKQRHPQTPQQSSLVPACTASATSGQ